MQLKAGSRLFVAAATVVAVVAAAPAGASTAAAGATAKSACSLSTDEQFNLVGKGTYITSLKARNVGCEKAKSLVVKYHECRRDNGGRDGHCSSFAGFSCSEYRNDSAPQQFSAKARCTKGAKKFVHTYTQNT
jgi:hypothetical protein